MCKYNLASHIKFVAIVKTENGNEWIVCGKRTLEQVKRKIDEMYDEWFVAVDYYRNDNNVLTHVETRPADCVAR